MRAEELVDRIFGKAGKRGSLVVTGANGGLGLESARALAGAGAHVIMAARNQDRALAAREEILAVHPDASFEIMELDLGSLASVQTAAETIVMPRSRSCSIQSVTVVPSSTEPILCVLPV